VIAAETWLAPYRVHVSRETPVCQMNKTMQSYYERARDCYDLKEIERLGLSPDMDQRHMILTFIALLLKWNKVAGLISPKDEACLFLRHFCDSLQPLLLFGFKKGATVLDVGAGGGFPSIPIRIFRPDLSFVLVESNTKKSTFLNEVLQQLTLDNVTVHGGRLEKLKAPTTGYDYVISRGVTSMQKFSQLAKPYLAPDGRIYLYKTKQFSKELEAITANKDKDGVRINEIAEYDLGNQILGLNLVSLELVRE
jgi:16S rRNA (guanine527-N7)-methyltransferase